MGERLIEGLVAIATAVIGIAIIAVLVGQHSQTASVVSEAGTAFSGILRAATAPATGGQGL